MAMDLLHEILKENPRLEPFRSSGFLNRNYDKARISIELPIHEARKLMAEIRKEKYLRDI